MFLPKTGPPSSDTNKDAICCYRREQGETTTLPAGFLQRLYLPYLRAPSTTTHDRHTSEAHDCRGCKTNGVSFPIPVPIHWQDEVKADLDRDVRLEVIEPVPVGEPVTWCHRMVVCSKKSGKPRCTVDFQPLNAHATRETHHTQSPYHQVRSVPPSTKKTVCDAWNGYHSVPLCTEDRHLTTFITPWGRYRYCTLPQGYIASGDSYFRRFDEIVSNVRNKIKVIDDTLLWSNSIEDCFFRTGEWLNICGKHGSSRTPQSSSLEPIQWSFPDSRYLQEFKTNQIKTNRDKSSISRIIQIICVWLIREGEGYSGVGAYSIIYGKGF